MEKIKMEKIKFIILFYLVIQSMVFTYILWFGSPDYEEIEYTVKEPYVFQERLDIEEAVTPSAVVMPRDGEGVYFLQPGMPACDTIWEKSRELLRDSRREETEALQAAGVEEPEAVFYFDPPFPLTGGILRAEEENIQVTGLEIYELPEDDGIREVFWKVHGYKEKGEEEKVLAGSSGSETWKDIKTEMEKAREKEARVYIKVKEEEIEEQLPEGMNAALQGDAGYIYLPGENVELSSLFLEKENFSAEKLIKAIFLDPNLVRKIEERDQDVIYTDGEKFLNFSGSSFKYSAPPVEGGEISPDYNQALKKAGEYLCHFGGWPPALRLEKVSYYAGDSHFREERQRYRARWNYYHRGFPLLGEGKGVWMEFNDRGLASYHREVWGFSRKEGVEKEIATASEVMEKIGGIYSGEDEENKAMPQTLKQLRLVYFAKEENESLAEPCWAAVFDREMLILQAHDLEILYKGEVEDEFFPGT